jgi:putative ABC transport system ATP-binding protein
MTEPVSDVAVRCHEVTKTYGSGRAAVAALRGVDLEVRFGELLMVVGPSGCGKTTLVSIIAAILHQDGGRCEVLGRDLQRMGGDERIRFRGASIGFVFQMFNLLPALTAAENVAVPLIVAGMPFKAAAERARGLLTSAGLGARADDVPARLSGGEQQRVAIARALVHDPRLIICDEPTSNLDHEAGREAMTVLSRTVRNASRALIVVTHDERVVDFADRIARMDDGRIVEMLDGRDGDGA